MQTKTGVSSKRRYARFVTQQNAILRGASIKPLPTLILYVKLYLNIEGDDLLLLEEAEQALRTWYDIMAPQSWKDACAEPDLRMDILSETIRRRETEYTSREIKEAIRYVAESQEDEQNDY